MSDPVKLVESPLHSPIQNQNAHPSKTSVPSLSRRIKLTSVNLKEAALDSPSFRASVNHLDSQVINIETWLLAVVASIRKISRHSRDLHSVLDEFLECMLPSFLQDGLVDQEYTLASLRSTRTGLKRLWAYTLSSIDLNQAIIANMNLILSKNIKRYKDLRARFDSCQQRHDKYMHAFACASKTRDPAGLYEDASQLYQVRKDYLHISFDLVVETTTLGNLLDRLLVRISSDLWKRRTTAFSTEDEVYFQEMTSRVKSIQDWCDSYSITTDKLTVDMSAAREEVEKSTLHLIKPTLRLNDYNSAMINQKTLTDISENGFEKHGYLLLKTVTRKLSKPVWVKRWAFIKSGIFGFLVLSPSKTFVQETDKYGILLCNVRYNPVEDRRLCFDVKTSTILMTLQAETFEELKSWFKVFLNERRRVLQYADLDRSLLNVASNQYPPLLAELASTVDTLMDRALSSTRVTLPSGQIVMSSDLSRHISENKAQLKKDWYFQLPLIRPPLVTESTLISILAYSLVVPTPMPSALTANMWGLVNWGVYYMHNESGPETSAEIAADDELIALQNEHLVDGGLYYPPYYPELLIQWDIQMRSLFSFTVDPGEYCLMSFRGIWSPNTKQDLSSRCFVTANHIYIYMQALGFVSLYKGNISRFVAAESLKHRHYHLLKIYSVDGPFKVRLYLEDGSIIARKLSFLIRNQSRDSPQRMEAILQEFTNIESDVNLENRNKACTEMITKIQKEVASSHPNLDLQNGMTNADPVIIPLVVKTQSVGCISRRIGYSSEYPTSVSHIYPLPAKSLFHALLGDSSIIIRDSLSIGSIEDFVYKPWNVDEANKMWRSFNVPVNFNHTRFKVQVSQVIEDLIDDEYYNFTHIKSQYRLCHSQDFSIDYRFVIERIDAGHCRLHIYHRVEFDRSLVFNFLVNRFCREVAINHFARVHHRLRGAIADIGSHGKIVKAIYLYGKLLQSKETERIDQPPVVDISTGMLLRMVTSKCLVSAVRFVLLCAGHFSRRLRAVFLVLTMHRILLIVIAVSMMLNMFLTTKSTVSYWSALRTDKAVHLFLDHEPYMLLRLVYLKDTSELFNPTMELSVIFDVTNPQGSKCFNSFKESSFILNSWSSRNARSGVQDAVPDPYATQLMQSYHEIGIERHKLLVDLQILKEREKNLARAEWRKWLAEEYHKCASVESVFVDQQNRYNVTPSHVEGWAQVLEYCNDCRSQVSQVNISDLC